MHSEKLLRLPLLPPYLSQPNQPTTHSLPHPIPGHTLQLFCSHSFALSRPRPLVRLGAYWERKDEYNFYSFHHYIAFPLNKHTQCTHAIQPATRAHNLKRENILSRWRVAMQWCGVAPRLLLQLTRTTTLQDTPLTHSLSRRVSAWEIWTTTTSLVGGSSSGESRTCQFSPQTSSALRSVVPIHVKRCKFAYLSCKFT